MAFEIPILQVTRNAGSDLSAHQYKFVIIEADDDLAVAGAGVAAFGVLQDKPDAEGRAGNVMVVGISKVEAGATIASGARVMSNATGQAITLATAASVCVGYCVVGGAVGQLITVALGIGGDLHA